MDAVKDPKRRKQYTKDTADRASSGEGEPQEVEEKDMFFKQYNNIPGGFAIYRDRMFIGVPRRRFGIASTLNFVDTSTKCPLLKPYPNVDSVSSFVSVYRPKADECGRLWVVDTGLLEVPGNRVQMKQPEIIIFNLKTDTEILRYQLKPSDISNGTTSGFTSITIDVTESTCDDAYAYINDLAKGGLVVFSLRERDSWRFSHSSFAYDPEATNFTIGGYAINWTDGIFSIALADPDCNGTRTAYYHSLIGTNEFSITTDVLKNRDADFDKHFKLEGNRGTLSQSGIHVFDGATQTLIFASVALDGLVCWRVKNPLIMENMALIAQDHKCLLYIADVKIVGEDLWLLVNQMPRFIYSTLNTTEPNFFVFRGKIEDLIRGSVCEG